MSKTLSTNIELSTFALLQGLEFFKDKVIHVHTSKGSKVVGTTLSVMQVKEGCMSCVLFQDYSKQVDGTTQRATEKALKEQHASVLNTSTIEGIVQEIYNHYKKKGSI